MTTDGRTADGKTTLGRTTGYTDADTNASVTTYDLLSRPATVNDGKATRTYTYDGGAERRGLATGVADGQAGTFGGTYDADGRLTGQTWPNGIVVATGYDETASTWVSAGALVARMNFAVDLSKNAIRGVRVPLSEEQTVALKIGAPEFQRQ